MFSKKVVDVLKKADSEFVLPGTTIKVIAVAGLNGTNKVYAMRLSNMFLGTDLLNEEEKFATLPNIHIYCP